MGFGDFFWSGCRYTRDRLYDSLEVGLDSLGSLSSFASGMLFGTSFAIDEVMKVGGYESGIASGNVYVNITAINFQKSVQLSFPFSQKEQGQGSFSSELTDYVNPLSLQMAAFTAFGLGVGLKALSGVVGLYLKSLRERKHFQDTKGVLIAKPSWQEYSYAIAGHSTGAMTISFTTSAIWLSILKFSDFVNREYKFTYPSKSSECVNTPNYTGPVRNQTFNLEFDEKANTSITVYGLLEPLLIDADTNVSLDAKYGAGAFFDSKGVNGTAIAPTACLGFVTGNLSLFFTDKARKAHTNRLFDAGVNLGKSDADVESERLLGSRLNYG